MGITKLVKKPIQLSLDYLLFTTRSKVVSELGCPCVMLLLFLGGTYYKRLLSSPK
jgi:hypothetical protein